MSPQAVQKSTEMSALPRQRLVEHIHRELSVTLSKPPSAESCAHLQALVPLTTGRKLSGLTTPTRLRKAISAIQVALRLPEDLQSALAEPQEDAKSTKLSRVSRACADQANRVRALKKFGMAPHNDFLGYIHVSRAARKELGKIINAYREARPDPA